MRLIDEAELRRIIIAFATGLHSEVLSVDTVMMLLTQVQTIDAVPVVRCENCKYGYPCGDEIVCYHSEYELAEGKWSYKKDFFCAFGDTKEGADNG